MDLEFYVRNLIGAPSTPSAAPQEIPKPRRLDERFAAAAIDAVESSVAASTGTQRSEMSTLANARSAKLALEYNRVLSSGAFGDGRGYDAAAAISTIEASDLASQFGFDLRLACDFSLLADARLPRDQAAENQRRLGTRLLELIPPPPAATASPPPLTELINGMRALLDQLQRAGYVASYAIDDTDADDALWRARNSLSATRLQITLNDSASLRAALLLNGRKGGSPELSKPLLCAYLRANGVEVSETSEFFLDSVYRSSPLDYRPNQQILTLTISPAGAVG